MRKVLNGFIGSLIGALLGAAVTASTFGWNHSLEHGSSFLGPTREWWPLVAMIFGVIGAVVGLVMGLVMVLTLPRLQIGLLAGVVVGLVAALIMLSTTDPVYWQFRTEFERWVPPLLSLVGWGLVGEVMSLVAEKLASGRDETPPLTN